MNTTALTVAAIVFTIGIVIPICFAYILSGKFIKRYDMNKHSFSLTTEDIESAYEVKHIAFMSGENKLHGYIFGESNTKELVVFCHGLFGGAEEYLPFAMHFVNQGYTVFMYDNTGCNRSEGKSIKGALQGLFDLDNAMKFIMTKTPFSARNKVIVGHSWGGFTAAAYPDPQRIREQHIVKVISLAGFDKSPLAVTDFIAGLYGNAFSYLYPYCLLLQFIQYGTMCNISSVKRINSTDIPYLIMHGTRDKIIHIDSSAIYKQRRHITNSHVVCICKTDKNHNKHNTIFRDSEATEYMESRYLLVKNLKLYLKGEELEEALDKICADTDRFRINQLDEQFLCEIDTFLSEDNAR